MSYRKNLKTLAKYYMISLIILLAGCSENNLVTPATHNQAQILMPVETTIPIKTTTSTSPQNLEFAIHNFTSLWEVKYPFHCLESQVPQFEIVTQVSGTITFHVDRILTPMTWLASLQNLEPIQWQADWPQQAFALPCSNQNTKQEKLVRIQLGKPALVNYVTNIEPDQNQSDLILLRHVEEHSLMITQSQIGVPQILKWPTTWPIGVYIIKVTLGPQVAYIPMLISNCQTIALQEPSQWVVWSSKMEKDKITNRFSSGVDTEIGSALNSSSHPTSSGNMAYAKILYHSKLGDWKSVLTNAEGLALIPDTSADWLVVADPVWHSSPLALLSKHSVSTQSLRSNTIRTNMTSQSKLATTSLSYAKFQTQQDRFIWQTGDVVSILLSQAEPTNVSITISFCPFEIAQKKGLLNISAQKTNLNFSITEQADSDIWQVLDRQTRQISQSQAEFFVSCSQSGCYKITNSLGHEIKLLALAPNIYIQSPIVLCNNNTPQQQLEVIAPANMQSQLWAVINDKGETISYKILPPVLTHQYIQLSADEMSRAIVCYSWHNQQIQQTTWLLQDDILEPEISIFQNIVLAVASNDSQLYQDWARVSVLQSYQQAQASLDHQQYQKAWDYLCNVADLAPNSPSYHNLAEKIYKQFQPPIGRENAKNFLDQIMIPDLPDEATLIEICDLISTKNSVMLVVMPDIADILVTSSPQTNKNTTSLDQQVNAKVVPQLIRPMSGKSFADWARHFDSAGIVHYVEHGIIYLQSANQKLPDATAIWTNLDQ